MSLSKKVSSLLLILLFFFCAFTPTLANNPPKLTDGGANPGWITKGGQAVWHVLYSDPDGSVPAYVKVHFPSDYPPKSFEMKKVRGDFKNGALFEFSWQPSESLEYYFEASDGKSATRFPTYEGGTLAPVNVLTEKLDGNEIYFFSKENREPLWTFATGEDWVQNLAISSNGSLLAAKTNQFIYLFSKDSSTPIWKYQCTQETDFYSGWVDISDDGNYIIAGCQQEVYLFSKESNLPAWKYEASSGVYSVTISANGEYIAVGIMGTNEVLLFTKESNQLLWKYKAQGDIHGLAISANGNFIAAGAHCPDRRAYLFSKNSSQPLVSYVTSEDSPVWTAAASAEGKYFVYGLDGSGGFNNILLFSPNKSEPIRGWATGGWVRSVAMTADGKYIAAGSGADKTFYLFDRDKNNPLLKFKAGERVGSVDISADGNLLVAGSKDKNVYLFSKESSQPLWNSPTETWVNAVAISKNGNYLAAGNGASQYLSEGHSSEELNEGPKESFLEFGKEKPRNPLQRLIYFFKMFLGRLSLNGKQGIGTCGNRLCEPNLRETKESCPEDCSGRN